MKKIFLIISLIILLLIIFKINKEHFSIKKLPRDVSIKETDYKQGLYVIKSYHYDEQEDKKDKENTEDTDNKEENKKKISKIFLKVNETESREIKNMFSLTNSKNLKPNDLNPKEIEIVQKKGSNLRIDNGIYVTEEDSDTNDIKFSLQGLRYDKDNNGTYTTSEENKITDIRFKQYYDTFSPDDEVKYFMTFNNKLLYVEEIDKENDLFELKSISMDQICKFMGENYSYVGNKEFIQDLNNQNDKEFNRDYNTIPIKNMCPKSHPNACSGENWRNHCSKEIPNPDGSCSNFSSSKTFKNNNDYPMRNFKCNGFKCHNNNIGKEQVKTGPQENHCIEPHEFITHSFDIKNSTILDIPLSKFLFRIYSYSCNTKQKEFYNHNGKVIDEFNLCQEFPILTRKEKDPINFYDTIEVKRNNTSDVCEKSTEIENSIYSKSKDKYKLCLTKSGKGKEGLTKIKLKNSNESCNEKSDTNPNNWKEAMNTDTLIGCFGHNEFFNIGEEYKDAQQKTLEGCRISASNNNYYAFDGNDCYKMDSIPYLLKFTDSDCPSMGVKTGEFDLKKIKIYKSNASLKERRNIQKNRVYEDAYYKITGTGDKNNEVYEYVYDNDYLSAQIKTNSITENNSLQFRRVNSVSQENKNKALKYNEKVYIKFKIDDVEKKINPNFITFSDSMLLSLDYTRKWIGIDKSKRHRKNTRMAKTSRDSCVTYGYGLKYYESDSYRISEFANNCTYVFFPFENVSYGGGIHMGGTAYTRTANSDKEKKITIGGGSQVTDTGSTSRPEIKRTKREYSKDKKSKNEDSKVYIMEEKSGWTTISSRINPNGKYRITRGSPDFPTPGKMGDNRFDRALNILNSQSVYISVNRDIGRYQSYFRGYIPRANEFNNRNYLYTTQYNRVANDKEEHTIENLIDRKYIIPSKINYYVKENRKFRTVICIEKREYLYPDYNDKLNCSFNLSNNSNDELEFYIVKKNDIDLNKIITNNIYTPSDETINLDEGIYLFNPKYKLFLSINQYDEHFNSFIATNYTDLNNPNKIANSDNTYTQLVPKLCTLNINMVDKYSRVHDLPEFKKVCYRTEPYKINDFSKAIYSKNSCEENQININDSSDFYMCLDKKYVSDAEYDKMVPLQPTDNYGLDPFPLP